GRPVVLAQRVAKRLGGELLEIHHAVAGEQIKRLPRLRVKLHPLARHCAWPSVRGGREGTAPAARAGFRRARSCVRAAPPARTDDAEHPAATRSTNRAPPGRAPPRTVRCRRFRSCLQQERFGSRRSTPAGAGRLGGRIAALVWFRLENRPATAQTIVVETRWCRPENFGLLALVEQYHRAPR